MIPTKQKDTGRIRWMAGDVKQTTIHIMHAAYQNSEIADEAYIYIAHVLFHVIEIRLSRLANVFVNI